MLFYLAPIIYSLHQLSISEGDQLTCIEPCFSSVSGHRVIASEDSDSQLLPAVCWEVRRHTQGFIFTDVHTRHLYTPFKCAGYDVLRSEARACQGYGCATKLVTKTRIDPERGYMEGNCMLIVHILFQDLYSTNELHNWEKE